VKPKLCNDISSPNEHKMEDELTQSVRQPEDRIHREEQGTLTRVVNRAGHIIVTLTNLSIEVGFSISLCVGGGAPRRLGAAPGLPPGLEGDITGTAGLTAQAPQPGSDKGLRRLFPRSVRSSGFQSAANCCGTFGIGVGPDGKTNSMVGDGTAGLGSTRSSGDVVCCRGVMKDGRRTEEGGGWLGTREGIFQVGLMGVGVRDG